MKVARVLINNDDFFYEDNMVTITIGFYRARSWYNKTLYFNKETYIGRIYNIDIAQNKITLDISDKYKTNMKTILVSYIIDIKKI